LIVKKYPLSSFKPFIGCMLRVLYSKNRSIIGASGVIVFESRNMFYIKVNDRIKGIPKKGSIFLIIDGDRKIIAHGDFLSRRFIKLRKMVRGR